MQLKALSRCSLNSGRLGAVKTDFPGDPVPVTDHSLSEEPSPNVQSEPPLTCCNMEEAVNTI